MTLLYESSPAIDASPSATEQLRRGDRLGFDPFAVPEVSCDISSAPHRSPVVIRGTVVASDVKHWVGGQVLEVALADASGLIMLGFFGRRHVAGVEPGRQIVVAGTVGVRRGRPFVMNPYIWLVPCEHSDG